MVNLAEDPLGSFKKRLIEFFPSCSSEQRAASLFFSVHCSADCPPVRFVGFLLLPPFLFFFPFPHMKFRPAAVLRSFSVRFCFFGRRFYVAFSSAISLYRKQIHHRNRELRPFRADRYYHSRKRKIRRNVRQTKGADLRDGPKN